MKKLFFLTFCMMALFISSFAQLLDEKNVTITMDLQPVLQLKLEGPDQIDFTFDDISEYYSGITKYGANILKVSSSVSFDLWATGLSQTTNYLWDNPVTYQPALGGGANAIAEVPITALELHQFPANPSIADLCTPTAAYSADDDYSQAFAVLDITSDPPSFAAGAVNNCINSVINTTPYEAPIQGVATAEEKYIAGGDGTGVGCQVVGGTYLQEAMTGGIPTDDGYFFVMDYRILPGLPVIFPSHQAAANANSTALAITGPDGACGGGTLGDVADVQYVAPGVYTMYIKYILVEDQ